MSDTTKTERLGLRTSERQRDLLRAASDAEGTSVSDFVLAHATRAAEQVLADRRQFELTDRGWDQFVARLDEPERDLPRLRQLLEAPSVFDD